MFQRIIMWFVVCIVAFCAAPVSAHPHDTGFLNRIVKVNGVPHRYQVYVPREWNKSRKWPTILFLQGHTSEGDDGLLQTEVGISGAIRRHADRFPVIVVFPQPKLA